MPGEYVQSAMRSVKASSLSPLSTIRRGDSLADLMSRASFHLSVWFRSNVSRVDRLCKYVEECSLGRPLNSTLTVPPWFPVLLRQILFASIAKLIIKSTEPHHTLKGLPDPKGVSATTLAAFSEKTLVSFTPGSNCYHSMEELS